MAEPRDLLPAGVHVLERGWLSSNNILMLGPDQCARGDSGYCSNAAQTLALVQQGLGGRRLDLLVNTHLHSDHCGGNAALQAAYPAAKTLVPPGHLAQVQDWDAEALGYPGAGQTCPRFSAQGGLPVGAAVRLGQQDWQVFAAPGHDPNAVLLFEPQRRVLLSADALWEHGFGVVFPGQDGASCFDEVARTLDLIEALRPALVIPGHGAPFTGVAAALQVARERLAGFVAEPRRHLRHAARVMVKFKLLEVQKIDRQALLDWVLGAAYVQTLLAQYGTAPTDALDRLLAELNRPGGIRLDGETVCNA